MISVTKKGYVLWVMCFFIISSLITHHSSLITIYGQTTSPNASATPTPSPAPLIPDQEPQTEISLTISPPFINVVTDPGVPVSYQLKIRNNSNVSEFLKISLVKFSANETGDRPRLEFVTEEDEFIKWISFSENQFTLDPNELRTIKLTVSPPRDAALGYYYAVIIERVQERPSPAPKEIITSGAPTFLIILEVRSPNARKDIALLDFKTSSLWYEYLPTTFNIKFKNTGNIHLIPSGDIFIDWGGQRDKGIVPINGGRGNILPGTIRTYNAIWDDAFISRVPKLDDNEVTVKDSNGNIIYETNIDWSKITKFRIGKYTAHMLAVYDNGQRDIPLEATVSFWVIPWKIILASLATLLLIFLGLKATIRPVIRRIRGNRPPLLKGQDSPK